MLRLSAVLAVALGGCGDPAVIEVRGRVVDSATGLVVGGALVRAAGGDETTSAADGSFVVRVPAGEGRAVRAVAPDRCPAERAVDVVEGAEVLLELEPRLSVREAELGETGFNRTVPITVATPCDADEPLRWEQVAGPELGDRMAVSDGGRRLQVRVHPLEPSAPSGDIVPLAYADVARYRLVVSGELAGEPHSVLVRVSAATPHGGLAGAPPGHAIYLRGAATLRSKPAGSSATLEARAPFSRFVPDVEGRYVLASGSRAIDLFVAPRRGEPETCGAAGCHAAERALFASSPHANELAVSSGEDCAGCHELTSDASPLGCAGCHVPHPNPVETRDAALTGSAVCATCHDTVVDPEAPPHPSSPYREWLESTKSDPRDESVRAEGCAHCHTGAGFIRWIETGRVERAPAGSGELGCASCHDPHEASRPHSLRAFERAPELVDLPAQHLGTGAVCFWCHRAQTPRRELVEAPHSPQANVLLGRGSTLVRRASEPGAHALLADSCVACHMAAPDGSRAGGHSFSVRDPRIPGEVPAASACAGCHGRDVPVQAIGGIRDWDGDGRADNVGREFREAIARVKRKLAARIRLTGIQDDCGTPVFAADVAPHQGRMVLVDADGHYLGDCDRDGNVGAGRVVTVERLSDHMRRLVWDLGMIEADGSEGRHNPGFTFEVLRAIENDL